MRFARTIILTLGLVLLSMSSSFAFNAKDILNAEDYNWLKKFGSLEKVYNKQSNANLALTPNTPLANAAKNAWTASKQPVFMVEKLFLVSKNELIKGNPSAANIDKVSKIMRSLSTLQGIQYKNSKGKTETLYKEAYCIKGAKDRTKVPDDLSGNADKKVVYCYQNDNSFGKTNYRVDYRQSSQELSAVLTNTTAIYVGPVKGIAEDNLKICVVPIDCGDEMLIYFLIQANFPNMSFLEDRMELSLNSRLNALYGWFVKSF